MEKNARNESTARAVILDFGMGDIMTSVLKDNATVEIVSKHYGELEKRLKELKLKAPESLKEKAEMLYNELMKSYQLSVIECFELDIATTLTMVERYFMKKEDISKYYTEKNKKAESMQHFLEDIEQRAENCKNKTVNLYVQNLYRGYIPENTPDEAKFIFDILGSLGPVIPVSGIFGDDEE